MTNVTKAQIALVGLAALVLAGGASAGGRVSISPTIVLDRSIAGVSLGESRSAVEGRIGHGYIVSIRDDTSTAPPSHVERLGYDAAGLYVTYVSAGTAARALRAGRVVVLETTWTSFRTPEGVHVGSPLAAVKTIPGVKCFAAVCQHGYTGAVGRGGTSFLVDPVRRRVVRIVVSFSR